MSRLMGIHAVGEALRAGRPLNQVLVARESKNRRLQPIIDECRKLGVPLRFEPRAALDRLAQGGAHQGIIAEAASKTYASLDDVIGSLDHPGLLVVLDGVEDPHNLGAIIRSAHAAGADAILLPERRSAGLTETVAKAAAGALEYLPVVRIANVNRALETLKEKNYWIYGLDERGTQSYDQPDYSGNAALVLGGEGKGLHELTAKRCDFLVKIPVAGRIASLNVSVAAGIVLFEVLRRRRGGTKQAQ
ncbi:MAG: 23S rRNA (guanosine(2251)-2'-O)-methyltransferase RlmB [Bryobacterales bacterium]